MFIQPNMSIISAIKVPNAFVFNLQEIENVTPIRKDATFCEVKLFRYREARYAFKVIHKSQIPSERFEEEYKRVVNEIRILYQLNHPYIVKLFFHEETEEEIRLLMDYGGTRLRAHFKNTYQNEEEVKKIVKQILEALKYLHDEGFIHRDLEPENILLNKQEQTIKLIDFGFIDEVAFRRTKIGSFHYMAPEITGDHNYNQKVDIWSLGIIVYEMLHQDLPFCSRKEFDEEEFEHNKRNLRIEFDNQISEQAIHFIKKMLVLDPESRASASELLRHEFISPEDDLSMFDREGTQKKTHKYQYIRQQSSLKQEESIEEVEGRLKRTTAELFACLHHQRDTLGGIFQTYRQILTKSIEDKQKKLKGS